MQPVRQKWNKSCAALDSNECKLAMEPLPNFSIRLPIDFFFECLAHREHRVEQVVAVEASDADLDSHLQGSSRGG